MSTQLVELDKLLEISRNIVPAVAQQGERILNLEGRVTIIENSKVCSRQRANQIGKACRRRAAQILVGGPKSPLYRTAIKRLYLNYYDVFGITSYHETLEVDYDRAMEWIEAWRPKFPFETQE